MTKVGLVIAVALLGACASASLPKPIKYWCAQSAPTFVSSAVKAFEANGYQVRSTDIARGEVTGFKPEKIFMIGDSPVRAGPYLVTARLHRDTMTVLVFTVKEDGVTPERSWDETATDEFEKSQYMPLLSDLRALCRPPAP
ncbi:MAG: hypothetical protein RML35_15115 [Chloroherpetonaceae bacterium]|nr:hypothetical protein [Chloroherpetonaceae bacterium]MDW8467435.1 hypothetical protein [Chloroherpetonaceae bacterium]